LINPYKDVAPEILDSLPNKHDHLIQPDEHINQSFVEELEHDQSDSYPPGKDLPPEPEDIFESLK
jgi:hypothetical protein